MLPLCGAQLAFLGRHGVAEADVLEWDNAHVCPECGEHFRSSTRLDDHQVRVHERFKFVCRHCRKTFKTCESMRVHVSTFHHGKGDIECGRCRRRYSCRKYFLDHACEHRRRALERMANSNADVNGSGSS